MTCNCNELEITKLKLELAELKLEVEKLKVVQIPTYTPHPFPTEIPFWESPFKYHDTRAPPRYDRHTITC